MPSDPTLPTDNHPLPAALFVDDEPNIIRSLKRLCMDEAFPILTAASAEEGLDLIAHTQDLGVIVSDQRMPGMNGVDFLEEVRRTRPEIIRILLTGHADLHSTIEAVNRGGIHRYISKPWQDDNLLQIIHEALKHFGLQRENERLMKIISQQNKKLKDWNAQLKYHVQMQTLELSRQNDELKNLNQKQKDTFRRTLMTLSDLMELRDPQIKSHTRNVAAVALNMARRLDLPANETETIFIAAMLHDIGKLGMSDVLLFKSSQDMDADDRKIYENYPVVGQTALDAIEELRDAGRIIRHHCERFDGQGFPDGLAGDKIPLGSRIIALVNFVDRAISRSGADNARQTAIRHAEREMGASFDPLLFSYLDEATADVYQTIKPGVNMVERELLPADLTEGLVVSREVRTGSGLLLMNAGMELTTTNIQNLRRFATLDPSSKGIFVWIQR